MRTPTLKLRPWIAHALTALDATRLSAHKIWRLRLRKLRRTATRRRIPGSIRALVTLGPPMMIPEPSNFEGDIPLAHRNGGDSGEPRKKRTFCFARGEPSRGPSFASHVDSAV